MSTDSTDSKDQKKSDQPNSTITLARKKFNFTIDDLSEKTGIPEFVIKSIEDGRRMPSIEELHSLSTTLNISYLDIVGELLEVE